MSTTSTEGASTSTKTRKKAALSNRPAKLLPERVVRMVFGSNSDQFLLNAVKEACYGAFSLPTFEQTLQKIKSHFFDRNYDAVFQNPEHLPVYSARYAPSRALCYYHMFLEHPQLLKPLEGGPSTILCIGAGAGSELMGIAAAMVHVAPLATTSSSTKTKKSVGADSQDKVNQAEPTNTHPTHSPENTKVEDASKQTATAKKEETTPTNPDTLTSDVPDAPTSLSPSGSTSHDVGSPTSASPTADIIPQASNSDTTRSPDIREDSREHSLVASMQQQLNLSSQDNNGTATVSEKKVKVKKPKKHQVTVVIQDYVDWSGIIEPMQKVIQNRMNLPKDRLKVETEVSNILDLDAKILARVAEADLITFLFVLNELFQDKKRTMLLVAKVVAAMRPGAHMLVADSAGSFSNLKVGERTYMVYMMLDHLKDLEVVYKDDSTWYRCPPNVTYPLKLENMRHFVRIYRKL
ncbi:hypothetical protein BGW42_008193 [Actinomortierella wolfii]|nr:hypothetical protein BGW42_008193 [Actinomortierella wolfii]